jgi:hypothetical protein
MSRISLFLAQTTAVCLNIKVSTQNHISVSESHFKVTWFPDTFSIGFPSSLTTYTSRQFYKYFVHSLPIGLFGWEAVLSLVLLFVLREDTGSSSELEVRICRLFFQTEVGICRLFFQTEVGICRLFFQTEVGICRLFFQIEGICRLLGQR